MDDLPLITCNQDKNSHFYLCLCKTAVALDENLVTKDIIGRDIYFDKMFNVELSDIRRKIEYETKHINCVKCGEHLGHQRVKPPRPPYTEPSIVYRVRWNSLLEWDGNELIEQAPPYAPSSQEGEGEPSKIRNTSQLTQKQLVKLCNVFGRAGVFGPKTKEAEPNNEAMIVASDLNTYMIRSKTNSQTE